MVQRDGPVRVPDPVIVKVRKSAFSRVMASLFAFTLLTGLTVGTLIAFAYWQFIAEGPLNEKKIFQVNPGMKRSAIGAQLQDEGIVSNASIFTAAAYVNGFLGGRLKSGEYEFPPKSNIDEVLAIITGGRAVTYKLTVPEGWTTQMAVARIQENDVLTGEVASIPLEGAIMPETYVFRRGLTRQKMLEDMQAAQEKILEEAWNARTVDDILKTKEQAVVLASIVEKETAIPEERPLIASVFLNRLKQGIRLQSDPTIIYGLVGGKGKLDRGLTKDDLESATPYNTYKIDGLPPGPIANPGRASLVAVLNPPDTGYLYFVADGSGGHAFAKTLEEHNANVAKWRKIEDAQVDLPTTVASTAPIADTPPAAPAVAAEAEPAEVATAVEGDSSSVVKPIAKPDAGKEALKPGTWMMVANQLVPIPKQKPKQ